MAYGSIWGDVAIETIYFEKFFVFDAQFSYQENRQPHTQSACKGKIVTCNEVKIEQSIQQMECLLYFVLLRSYYKWFK